MEKQNGFTLIEVSVVVAIVGILALTTINAYQDYVTRSQVTEAFNIASFYKIEMANIHAESGRCPTLDDFSLDSMGTIKTRYLSTIMINSYVGADCAFIVIFSNLGTSTSLQNKKIQMAMTSKAGGVHWSCYSPDIQQKFLPRACIGI
ncbi:pilin [Acinetobacter dispersus]|uniref:pilin n=1 Tax=Acinetobacter dispersus TaxID=70348 RepID=UPI00292A5828|nr:pilin [Acinetobacter dispersus]MCU4336997.1 pilin [Acinetobacter dispersus]